MRMFACSQTKCVDILTNNTSVDSETGKHGTRCMCGADGQTGKGRQTGVCVVDGQTSVCV